jgi:hypothetical protein
VSDGTARLYRSSDRQLGSSPSPMDEVFSRLLRTRGLRRARAQQGCGERFRLVTMGANTVSEFRDAIAWRSPTQLSFIVNGVWDRGAIHGVLKEIAADLEAAAPGSRLSPFVATDDDWPCEVGVFDVELSNWPDEPELFCDALLATVCRRGAGLSWMMFDGSSTTCRTSSQRTGRPRSMPSGETAA